MKYDDASWHYGGEFPSDLPPEAGGTHIGMFVAWCLLHGLAGEPIIEAPDLVAKLRNRSMTPGQWFLAVCDEKFSDEDLMDEGNRFAQYYFELETGKYMADYEATVGSGLETLYHVPDTWETYNSLAPVISRRFQQWSNPPKWWKIWKRS